MLANLPFPEINLNSVELITEIVRNEVRKSKGQNISKESDIYIEYLIAQLYRLLGIRLFIIFEALQSCQQLKPISRLLNCQSREIFEKHGI